MASSYRRRLNRESDSGALVSTDPQDDRNQTHLRFRSSPLPNPLRAIFVALYVLACRRQLPEIDSPETLAEYRALADEAEAVAAMVVVSHEGS